jgi:serine O-acetyltransferase
MLEKIRDWLKVVRRDLLHAASGTNYCQGLNLSFQSYLITLLKPEYQLVFLYRIYSEIYKHKPKIIGYLLYLFVKFIYKCDLHPKSVIGPGFMVMHGFDLVVGPDVRIGRDVVVFNGVNMGKKHVGVLGGGMPQIGDACVIGTGAKLLGPITLGKGVVVGANSVVLHDVADGKICVGIPARVIGDVQDESKSERPS